MLQQVHIKYLNRWERKKITSKTNIIEKDYNWAYGLTPRSLTTHIIIHHAAAEKATPDGIHAYHLSKGWAGIAYHYLVTKEGTIFRGRPENVRGAHTINWNYCSIGICFEGNFENEQMETAQFEAGRDLINDIITRYPSIVVSKHKDFSQTACPGKNFPFTEMIKKEVIDDTNTEETNEPAPWAKDACDFVIRNGIFKGDEKGNFHWRNPISRQELAVVIERIINLNNQKSLK